LTRLAMSCEYWNETACSTKCGEFRLYVRSC
jgi:hypothetical protein